MITDRLLHLGTKLIWFLPKSKTSIFHTLKKQRNTRYQYQTFFPFFQQTYLQEECLNPNLDPHTVIDYMTSYL
jgi:hypothetical protein